MPYYAEHRDLAELRHASLILYREWSQIAARAGSEARQAGDAVGLPDTIWFPADASAR